MERNNIMNATLKHYLISIVTSFVAGFAAVMLAEIDHITLASLSDGTLVGIAFTAIRTGIKGMLEILVFVSSSNKS